MPAALDFERCRRLRAKDMIAALREAAPEASFEGLELAERQTRGTV